MDAYLRYAAQSENAVPLVTPGLSQKFVDEKLRQLKATDKGHQFVTPGYIDDEDLPVLYAQCSVFLFPSLSEGFGMPVIEAMACGAPVVSSSATCLPEIAGNAAILANPLKADEIAAGILALTTDESLRSRKIAQGYENATRFNWKSTAESVLNLYEAVLSEVPVTRKHPGFFHKYVFLARD